MARFDDELKKLANAGLDIELAGGQCPVQICGTLTDGNYLYFRARGNRWEIAIAANEDDALTENDCFLIKDGDYGTEPYEAGYMPFKEAVEIVLAALAEYRGGVVAKLEKIKPNQLWRNIKKGTIYKVWYILPDTNGDRFVVYGETPNERYKYVCHTEIEGQRGLIEDGVIRWLKPHESYPKCTMPWARPIEMWHSKFQLIGENIG